MRRSGRTTKQLEEIVQRARDGDTIAFVWPEGRSLFYPSDIVAALAPEAWCSNRDFQFNFPERGLIRIVPVAANAAQFQGTTFDIVFDHAIWNRRGASLDAMVRAAYDQDQRRATMKRPTV